MDLYRKLRRHRHHSSAVKRLHRYAGRRTRYDAHPPPPPARRVDETLFAPPASVPLAVLITNLHRAS